MREFDLLAHVYAANPRLGSQVVIPPGDDMAQLELNGRSLLAAVDQLVDGRHVDLTRIPLALAGRKAVTRCLSDVAAMAARPVASLVAVVLPADFGRDRATALFDAMRETAEHYGCPLIGGDIAVHSQATHPLTCSVTVLAEPADTPVIRRNGARAGDDLYVSGRLGGSVDPDGGGHHLTFEPRIELALALAAHLGDGLHSMIDISDGLGRDASHLAHDSVVRIEIDADCIPCRDGMPWRRAASDGEDYELLFTCTGSPPASIEKVPITRIGQVTPRQGDDDASSGVVFLDAENRFHGDDLGWQHES